jgi:hypothetical protein
VAKALLRRAHQNRTSYAEIRAGTPLCPPYELFVMRAKRSNPEAKKKDWIASSLRSSQ